MGWGVLFISGGKSRWKKIVIEKINRKIPSHTNTQINNEECCGKRKIVFNLFTI